MDAAELEQRLAELQDDYQAAEVKQGGGLYEPPPDGEWQALTHQFDWYPGKQNPAELYFRVTYEVTNSAEYAGRRPSDLYNVSDPERITWFKSWLARMGVDTELPLAHLARPGALNPYLDVPVLIKIEHRFDDFGEPIVDDRGRQRYNCWLQRRINGESGENFATMSEAERAGVGAHYGSPPPEGDVPFNTDDFAPRQTGPADDDIPF